MRQYLLGQLAEPDQERIELRLMSDPAFNDEFDIVVDEIAALYVREQFAGEEKERVEQFFLKSPDRQNKVAFMGEFLRQIAAAPARGNGAPAMIESSKPGIFERLRAALRNPSPALRTAAALAILVIVIGAALWLLSGRGSGPTYASLELAMATADRSTGTRLQTVNLSGKDELRLKLKLPDDAPPNNTYRVQLRGERVSRELPVQQQDSHSLAVAVSTNGITHGSYAIELIAVAANGTEVPLRGAYLFVVE